MADGNLPTSEKVLGWAVVICILVPIASMALDKNAASVAMFFYYLIWTVIAVGALALAGFFLWSGHKRRLESSEPPLLDAYGRPITMWVSLHSHLMSLPINKRRREIHLGSAVFSCLVALLLWWAWTSAMSRDIGLIGQFIVVCIAGACSYLFLYWDMFHRHKQLLFPPEEQELVDHPPIKIVLSDFESPSLPDPPPPPPFFIRDFLTEQLRLEAMDKDYPLPSEPVMRLLLDTGETLFADAIPEEPVKNAVLACLITVLKRLPRKDAPFLKPIIETAHAPSFIWDLTLPLRNLPHFKPVIDRFNSNMGVITDEHNAEARKSKIVARVAPQDYRGTDIGRYLDGTPLRPLLDIAVPFQPFTEQNRCAHHWCLGKTRRGKTTFLRHLIKYDLAQTAEGNCSLVVIDSKTLIREMRTLRQFGEELDDKLILIDSDVAFPLNPFHLPKEQARSILLYMLGSLSDASDLQSGALGYYIDAALQSDAKSLQTILDYMRLPKGQVPPRLDKETADWFKHTRPTLHAATSGGIQQRLANFLRDHRGSPLMRMLTADSWGLDLYKELHEGGKVLLVDTDWLKNGPEGANLLGRLIIALIENFAMRRMKNPGKACWVYIDEASDYLANDSHFVQILIKAAAAKVGMTVAYQFKGMPGVGKDIEGALQNAEIHSVCEQRGTVQLTIEERPLTLPVGKLEFDHEPQNLHYEAMREELKLKYPYKTVPPPPVVQEPKDYK